MGGWIVASEKTKVAIRSMYSQINITVGDTILMRAVRRVHDTREPPAVQTNC